VCVCVFDQAKVEWSCIYLYNILGWSSFRGQSAVMALDDKTSFGLPFVLCVLELSRKSPYFWACFHSLSPLSAHQENGKEIKHTLKDNGKEINQELHTILLLSRTVQLSAHQKWEGNKTYIKG